ncbi:TPA: hypothetical protein ACGK4U_004067 [Escherichia coli]
MLASLIVNWLNKRK